MLSIFIDFVWLGTRVQNIVQRGREKGTENQPAERKTVNHPLAQDNMYNYNV
jgi:hypothetical protein